MLLCTKYYGSTMCNGLIGLRLWRLWKYALGRRGEGKKKETLDTNIGNKILLKRKLRCSWPTHPSLTWLCYHRYTVSFLLSFCPYLKDSSSVLEKIYLFTEYVLNVWVCPQSYIQWKASIKHTHTSNHLALYSIAANGSS